MVMRESERTRESERATTSQSVSERPQSQSAPVRPRERQLTIPPPAIDELEERYANKPEGAFAPEQAIDEQIADLEAWALDNVRRERLDLTRFWLLRGLGFVSAVGATAAAAVHHDSLAVAAGSVAALAITIDSAWPTTADRKARRRAIRDLRELQHTLKLKWDKVRLAYPDPFSARRIAHALALLDATQSKREDIGKYLGDASPGIARRLQK